MDRGVHKNRTYIEQTCRPKQFQKSIDINRRTDNQNHVDFVQILDALCALNLISTFYW